MLAFIILYNIFIFPIHSITEIIGNVGNKFKLIKNIAYVLTNLVDDSYKIELYEMYNYLKTFVQHDGFNKMKTNIEFLIEKIFRTVTGTLVNYLKWRSKSMYDAIS